jgi:hopene-associated glycosyltransferase HpnB
MATILTVATALSAVIWVYLLAARHGFWRCDQRLGDAPAPSAWPHVVAVVPARDEAETIEACVTSLTRQNYPGDLRIVVVDDSSRDATASIVHQLAETSERPVALVSGTPLAAGWTGKLWALDQGVRAAGDTDVLWFTDADIIHEPDVLQRLAAKAVSDDRALVSLMVRLRCEGFWERILVPAFIFFFQKLYPFPAINDPASRVAGAAGGCVLIRREALDSIGGLVSIRDRLIDDCALAKAVKSTGRRIWLGLAEDSHSLRAYDRLDDVWDMVARTAFTQLDHSWAKLAGTVIGMVLLYLLPPLVVLTSPIHHIWGAAGLGALTWIMMSAAYAPTLAYYRRPLLAGVIGLPVAGCLYTAMTVSSAWRYLIGRGGRWKDRHYESLVQRP